MSKPNWALLIGGSLIVISAIVAVFQNSGSLGMSGWKELDWRNLVELDYVTGQAPATLQESNGKDVKLPGFMVPLEDNMKKVKEFLLVPSPQACIHVPAPPPNQMVHVIMKDGDEAEAAFGPIWVYGKFEIKSKRSMYGESSFTLTGVKVEPYR